ncbi:hypothetical protein [Albirhodobacter sp. R86504]|uniref:hypothetical protein n=1 Tax=Albirhodobacter sp. R86504 TaxID=3093848 RepID=UPI00366EF1D4
MRSAEATTLSATGLCEDARSTVALLAVREMPRGRVAARIWETEREISGRCQEGP